VDDVLRHIVGDTPWLAADPFLGPASTEMTGTLQTGAWLLDDSRALPPNVESFLNEGPPPVYFGFGSMRGAEGASPVLIEAARAVGVRAIVSRGWGNLATIDEGADCLSIGDVAHAALFARVAAVVHHGGAGTTTAAARAGRAQVVLPHNYDQFYWAHRVDALGIGVAGPTRAQLGTEALAQALRRALQPGVQGRAAAAAVEVRTDGARVAARALTRLAAQGS
jgi:vancomycin aglycone glucosyltransferase